MLEMLLCSMFTLLPDYLYRRYVQGKRFGKEITLYSVWFELRWGITGCLILTVLLITTVLTLVTALPLFNQMLLGSLNPSLAHVRGVRVHLLEYVFVLLLTILTVACVKIVGAVLVEALLLIPAAAARNLNRSIKGFVWWSIAFSTVACLAGIYAPMRWDLPLPSGGAIILAAALIFVVTMLIRMALPRYREASV